MILKGTNKNSKQDEMLVYSMKIYLLNVIYKENIISDSEYHKIKGKLSNCKPAIFF